MMFKTLRYYWNVARGYRLQPWKSPYLRWRFETFLGEEAAEMNARKFFRLGWKYRAQMSRFIDWASDRRRVQRQVRRHALSARLHTKSSRTANRPSAGV